MNRHFISIPLLLLAGMLLTGCDFFSDDDDWVTKTVDRELTGEGIPIGECEGDFAGWTKIQFTGTGVGPPFGETELTATDCFDLSTGQFAGGEGTLVTNDGDEVYWTFQITDFNIQTGAYVDSGEFTDGTGAFEGAHGTFTGEGTMTVQFDENGQPIFPVTIQEDVTGEVTYRE